MDSDNNLQERSANAVSIFDKYAKEYADRFWDTAVYEESFNAFCDAVNVNGATILELACGPGNITYYMKQKQPDFKILATDLSPNMLIEGRRRNPDVDFRIMDCRDILKLEMKFDGIIMGFCLPYLSMEETRKLFHDAATVLSPEGIIYISTMEDDYSKSGLQKGSKGDEIFMHYYTEEILLTLLNDTGFEKKWVQRKLTLDSTGKEVTDLLLIAQKKKGTRI